MDRPPIERFIEALRSHGCDPKPDGNGEYRSRCPAHDDKNPSLYFREKNGVIVVKCQNPECSTPAVLAALGLTFADLYPGKAEKDVPRPAVAQSDPKAASRATRSYETPDEAVTAFEKMLGKPADHKFHYRDAAGNLVAIMLRWEMTDGKKEFRSVARRDDGRWAAGGLPNPHPLYGLPGLLANPTATVYVVEGEKKVDAALEALGLTAVTSGGAGSADGADWDPLAGRDVVILPDNDDPGRKYAEDVKGKLLARNPAARVRIVELPGLPPKGDVVDYIKRKRAAGFSDAAIRRELIWLTGPDPKRGFGRIPRAAVTDPEFARLTGAAAKCYVVLAQHDGPNTTAWPSVRTIARLAGLTRNGVQKALRQLEKAGFVHRRTPGGRKSAAEYKAAGYKILGLE